MNNELFEPKKVSVWGEGAQIEAKEFVMPPQSTESSDDIPTIPDIDDFQDILEKDVSKPPISEVKDAETANTLAEVSEGLSGSVEGIEGAIELLRSYVPVLEMDTGDQVWTVDSLLSQLAEEDQASGT